MEDILHKAVLQSHSSFFVLAKHLSEVVLYKAKQQKSHIIDW